MEEVIRSFPLSIDILQHETYLALNRCKLANEVLMNDNSNVKSDNTAI